jgi:hypothetical protein
MSSAGFGDEEHRGPAKDSVFYHKVTAIQEKSFAEKKRGNNRLAGLSTYPLNET